MDCICTVLLLLSNREGAQLYWVSLLGLSEVELVNLSDGIQRGYQSPSLCLFMSEGVSAQAYRSGPTPFPLTSVLRSNRGKK